MVKPDPYGDWVLFPSKEGERSRAVADEELVAAAREAWPRILAHAKKESITGGLGSETESLAKQVGPIWGSSVYIKHGDVWKWTFGINLPEIRPR